MFLAGKPWGRKLAVSVTRIVEYWSRQADMGDALVQAGPPFDKLNAHNAFSKRTTGAVLRRQINDQMLKKYAFSRTD